MFKHFFSGKPLSIPSDDLVPYSEVPCGRFRFRFQNEKSETAVDSVELVWKDFHEHALITGGSGSGKTSTVLMQLYEGLVFRAAHHPDPLVRRAVRVGGLVIEAKGDFTPKTKTLADRYSRTDSVIYFGPAHSAVYDPFGDPDELPMQKAHKMNEILKAANGGKEGSDPFWSQASQKLMMNLFLLHDALQKSGVDVEPISFRSLNLLCMDKGSSPVRSTGEEALLSNLKRAFTRLREILTEMDWELDSLWNECDPEGIFQHRLHQIRQKILEMQSSESGGIDNQSGKWILDAVEQTREEWSRILSAVPFFQAKSLRLKISALFLQREEAIIGWKQLSMEASKSRSEGALTQLLEKYRRLLENRGVAVETDLLYSYFKNEYLNPANDKTSASISMMVSNALMPFVTEPFDRIFSPQSTFDFSQVVDEGLLVVLDMPSAQYGVAQVLVSLMMKIDFFRTVLNRSRLRRRGGDRLVNQERHLIYLCDEFGSVATTGDQTGEAAFLDKVREYRCSCILAMQGLPSLLRRFSNKEVDALLQNCGIKVFLRNDDPSTNDYASRSLGSEIKVRLNQNAGAMEHFMDQQKKIGARSYTTSYEKGARFSPDQFVTFRIGEGVLRLPARFGESMIRKVHFAFNPVNR
jgi:hypothetical protein